MADKKVDRLLLKYEIDRNKIDELINRVDTARQSISATRKEALGLADAGRTAGNRLASEFEEANRAIDRMRQGFADARKEYEKFKSARKEDVLGGLSDPRLRANIEGRGGLGLGKAEMLASRTGAALRGLGAGAAGDVVSGGADILQLAENLKGASVASGIGLGTLTAGATAVGLAAANAAIYIKLMDDATAKLTEELGYATRTSEKYRELTKATTKEAFEGLKAQGETQADLIAQRDRLQKKSDETFARTVKDFGGGVGGDLRARAQLSRDKDYNEAIAKINELNQQILDSGKLINESFEAVQSGATAAKDAEEILRKEREAAAEAAKKQAAARLAILDEGIARELKIDQLRRSGAGTKIIQDLSDSAAAELRALRDRIPILEAEAKAGEQGAEKLEVARKRIESLTKDLEAFNYELARTQAGDYIKGLLGDLGGSANKLIDGVVKPFLAQTDRAVEDALARDKRVADTVKKYNDDIAAIEQRSLEQRAAIQERLNEKLVDIARDYAQQQIDALDSLRERQQDLIRDATYNELDAQRKAQYDRLDEQIKFQDTEAQASVDHARRLEDIRRQAQEREFDLILNRDFLGLFRSRRQTTLDIQDANRDATRAAQDRAMQFAQERQDSARAFAQEREQRLISYQRALEDAQAQYARELQQSVTARQQAILLAQQAAAQELQQLSTKTQAELRTRQAGYDAELRIAALYGQARVKQEEEIQKALLAQGEARLRQQAASTALSVVSTLAGALVRRPYGGSLAAGQPALVNDLYPGQRESFNGVSFPAGMGVFMPFQAGYVNNNSRSLTASQTNNIHGANPGDVLRMIDGRFGQLMNYYFGSN